MVIISFWPKIEITLKVAKGTELKIYERHYLLVQYQI